MTTPTTTDDAPLIHSKSFLVELGTGSRDALADWIAQFRYRLQLCTPVPGLPIPMEIAAFSEQTGRLIIRVLAPNPAGVVFGAQLLAEDGEPPVLPF
jgi:hypothetical protein